MAERGMKAKDLEPIIGSKGMFRPSFQGAGNNPENGTTTKGLFPTTSRNIFAYGVKRNISNFFFVSNVSHPYLCTPNSKKGV